MAINASDKLALAGDIGGTKTNLGLFALKGDRPQVQAMESYDSRRAKGPEDLIQTFLKEHPLPVESACFGIAGPVIKGVSKTTNLPWVVSEKNLRDLFGLEKIRLVNDLAATAKAIPVLEEADLTCLNVGKPEIGGTVGLVAPGTGLGMALLAFVDGKAYPFPSEGGHVEFAPKNETEILLLKHLLAEMPHVSVERLASGPGLFTIYSLLRPHRNYSEPSWLTERINRDDKSKAVSEAAISEKDPLCIEALDLFISVLGSAAGNLAPTGMTTGGIYLGGGIAPKILVKLQESTFMQAFTAKGRFQSMLTDIPVQVILNSNAAMIGAACCAFEI